MKQIKITNKKIKLSNILQKYKRYSDFSKNKEDAYEYIKILGLKACPYCNINYIYTVTNDKEQIVRPDIDHFEPKSKVQEKELDINNLVPSCLVCNERLKRDKLFNNKNHLNPIQKDFDSIAEFYIDIKSANYIDESNFDIKFKKKEFATNDDYKLCNANIRDFKLEERYFYHKDTVIDLFKDLKYYHIAKMQELSYLINNKNNIETYIINKIIDYKNININNVSLGKLKRDIAIKYSK